MCSAREGSEYFVSGENDGGGLLHIQELSLLRAHAVERLDGDGRVVLSVSQQTKFPMNKETKYNIGIQSKSIFFGAIRTILQVVPKLAFSSINGRSHLSRSTRSRYILCIFPAARFRLLALTFRRKILRFRLCTHGKHKR